MERRQFIRNAAALAFGAVAANTILPDNRSLAQQGEKPDLSQIARNKNAIQIMAGGLVDMEQGSIDRDRAVHQGSLNRDTELLNAQNEIRFHLGIPQKEVGEDGKLQSDIEDINNRAGANAVEQINNL